MTHPVVRETDAHPVSTMYVVTFSGFTSGGIMTSGTTCWTCTLRAGQPLAPLMVGLGEGERRTFGT